MPTRTFKVSLADNIVRLSIDLEAGSNSKARMEQIRAAVVHALALPKHAKLVLKYTDDEGDLCTLTLHTLEDLLTLVPNDPIRIQASIEEAEGGDGGEECKDNDNDKEVIKSRRAKPEKGKKKHQGRHGKKKHGRGRSSSSGSSRSRSSSSGSSNKGKKKHHGRHGKKKHGRGRSSSSGSSRSRSSSSGGSSNKGQSSRGGAAAAQPVPEPTMASCAAAEEAEVPISVHEASKEATKCHRGKPAKGKKRHHGRHGKKKHGRGKSSSSGSSRSRSSSSGSSNKGKKRHPGRHGKKKHGRGRSSSSSSSQNSRDRPRRNRGSRRSSSSGSSRSRSSSSSGSSKGPDPVMAALAMAMFPQEFAKQVQEWLPDLARELQRTEQQAELNQLGIREREKILPHCACIAEKLGALPETETLKPALEAYVSGSDTDHFGVFVSNLLQAYVAAINDGRLPVVQGIVQDLTASVMSQFLPPQQEGGLPAALPGFPDDTSTSQPTPGEPDFGSYFARILAAKGLGKGNGKGYSAEPAPTAEGESQGETAQPVTCPQPAPNYDAEVRDLMDMGLVTDAEVARDLLRTHGGDLSLVVAMLTSE